MAEAAPEGSRGLIIGKFMPPHHGHQYLIDFARKRVAELTVIVFTKSAEPIPGALRVAWLRELYPDVAVIQCEEEHPIDFDDPAIWDLWIGAIRGVYPNGPEVVFSSEAYGDELARRLGARHVLVDGSRSTIPISGSLLRQRPLDYWDFMAPCVRAYFVRRVCLLGAESTGKTTLAAALAERFHTVWVPEYARAYLESKRPFSAPEHMVEIARGQIASEDQLAREANRLLFCDTNLLATMVWSEHYFGRCPSAILEMADARHYDLHLLCAVDGAPWVADGVRDCPDERTTFHARFRRELEERRLPCVLLSGSIEERLAKAIDAVEPLVGS